MSRRAGSGAAIATTFPCGHPVAGNSYGGAPKRSGPRKGEISPLECRRCKRGAARVRARKPYIQPTSAEYLRIVDAARAELEEAMRPKTMQEIGRANARAKRHRKAS